MTTNFFPYPEIKPHRPQFHSAKPYAAGGRYYDYQNLILIFGYLDVADTVELVNHETLHFILHKFVGNLAGIQPDNIRTGGKL